MFPIRSGGARKTILLSDRPTLAKMVMVRCRDGCVDMYDHGAPCRGPVPDGLRAAAQVLVHQHDNANGSLLHRQPPFDIKPNASSCCQPVNSSEQSHHKLGLCRSA